MKYEKMNSRAKLMTGEFVDLPVKKIEKDNVITLIPDITEWENIDYIDLGYDFGSAKVGDEGYFVFPRGGGSPDDHIVCFDERPDAELNTTNLVMSFMGYVKNGSGWCMIPTGFTYEFHAIRGKKGNDYYAYPRFYIGGTEPYETIKAEYHLIEDADYVKICKVYREYMLTRGGCRPIKDRLNKSLEYAKDSVYIRVRLGWKPAPSPIADQTIENEPEMHVAMTFDEVGKLCEKLKAAGVEKAEICLIGWNVSGHDGRWPQHFPVEPKLGGEEGLRKLIEKAQGLGYQIVCHTNCNDSYTIADNYSEYWTRKKRDGSVACNATLWSGGLARFICPLKAVEYVKTELPKVRDLGFEGLHYIDVMTTVPLFDCYDENHPVTKRGCQKLWRNIAGYCKELFGGFSSEGCFDFIADSLDYGLYASFYNSDKDKPAFFTKPVPLWQIVYHGIILSNPYTSTINSPIKSKKHQLEVFERGGRPTFYIYSKFVTDGKNWMGNDDLTCDDEADTARTVKVIADMYRECESLSYLQTEFIEDHSEENGVTRTVYSDGSVMVCDYNSGEHYLEK